MTKQSSDATAMVQAMVSSRVHGACEVLVDASISRLLAGRSPVTVAKLADMVGADIERHTGVVVSAGRLASDIAYATGIDAQPGVKARVGAATVKAGKLVAYRPRSLRSP